MYFCGFNLAWYDDLKALGQFSVEDESDGLDGSDRLMVLVVVTHQNRLLVGNAEVNTNNCALPDSLEFAQPLMRDIEIVGFRHRDNNSVVTIVKRLFQPTRLDTSSLYRVTVLLGRKMNEQCPIDLTLTIRRQTDQDKPG